MAGKQNENVEEEKLQEEIEELEEEAEDESEDNKEDSFEQNMELNEEYGDIPKDEKVNSHVIINKVLDKNDTIRTTFLTESELGRPLFSVRFLSDLHDDALRLNLPILSNYYWEKIQNITNSGMSNKGFIMNLNVTQKKEQTRKRFKPIQIEERK